MKTTSNPFCWALLVAVLIALANPCPAQAQENAVSTAVLPTIRMKDVQLPRAIEILAKQADLNFILDPHLADDSRSVSIVWTNITSREALNRLLKEHDLELVENPATTVARIAPRNLRVKPIDPALIGTNAASASNNTNAAVVPIIMLSDAPLDYAIETLADQTHQKIDIANGAIPVSPPLVSFRWQNLTARQALVALLDNLDLTLVESPDKTVIHIKPKARN